MKTYFYILFFSCAVAAFTCLQFQSNEKLGSKYEDVRQGQYLQYLLFFCCKKRHGVTQCSDVGDSVKGSLGYKLYEKDHSNGSLLGKMYGDTLKAMCTFMIKGAESIQEVVFLRKDSLFVEGLSKRKTLDGKIVFAEPEKLHFDGLVLKQVPCK